MTAPLLAVVYGTEAAEDWLQRNDPAYKKNKRAWTLYKSCGSVHFLSDDFLPKAREATHNTSSVHDTPAGKHAFDNYQAPAQFANLAAQDATASLLNSLISDDDDEAADAEQKIQEHLLAGVKPRDQPLIRMLIEGRSQAEIATRLGFSRQRVSAAIIRATALMKLSVSATGKLGWDLEALGGAA